MCLNPRGISRASSSKDRRGGEKRAISWSRSEQSGFVDDRQT